MSSIEPRLWHEKHQVARGERTTQGGARARTVKAGRGEEGRDKCEEDEGKATREGEWKGEGEERVRVTETAKERAVGRHLSRGLVEVHLRSALCLR